jgi:glycosyltransferase involved in cell wall biosynthesis
MKLSIITINRNNAAGLEKTCLSVVTQTYQNLEWIIIDGNSNDNSVEIIKRYSHKAFYWISEPDTGVYNAMNKGIKIATGEFLLFLNSGDYLLHPWTLQEVIDEINISKYADVYYSDAVLDTYEVSKYPPNISLDFFLNDMINHQNCLIRRELFKHRLYNEDYKIFADRHFFIEEIIEHNIIFFRIKTNMSIYDTNGFSSKNKKYIAERKRLLKRFNGIKLFYLIITKKIINIIKYFLPYGLFKLLKSFKYYLLEKKRSSTS